MGRNVLFFLSMSLNLDNVKDVSELREIARLLVAENDRLHQRLQKLANEVDKLKGEDATTLQAEIAGLKRALDRERSKHSRPKSERRKPHRRNRKPKSEQKPQSGGKRTEQPKLELVEQELTLPEEDRRCEQCGGLAEPLPDQYEEGEMVTVVQREFKVLRYRRQKYVHACDCGCGSKLLAASPPLKVVPKGRYSLEFAAMVAQAKYHDQIPLERQAKQMRREGLSVQPNVLWDQVYQLYHHLRPSCDAIYTAAFEEPVLGADETGWPMLEKGKKLWQVRCLTSPRLSYFRIVGKKDTESAIDLLTHADLGVYGGTLVTDGAQAYGAAQRESEGAFTLAGCWSHARRYLLEAEPNFPAATEALDLIDELFAVEREAAKSSSHERLAVTATLRAERSEALLDKLREWMNGAATKWESSDLNRAIRYIDRRWAALTAFKTNPAVPIHNNASEFALRRPVLGRKVYYGSKSRLGTEVAALYYSLLETARKNGADPLDYLLTAARRAITQPGTATLPW